MKVLILGAAGRISRLLTDDLLAQTDDNLVLYGRNASNRIPLRENTRVKIVDGDFRDSESLSKAMQGVDAVYVNDMDDAKGVATIVAAVKKNNIKRIIVASILGIYNEVPGAFGKWNQHMVGIDHIHDHARTISTIEVPEIDYTILRLTWLYNQKGNRRYRLTQKGEPFKGTEVTREAVSQLIVDILKDKSGKYIKTSLGVSEPGADGNKPSFY